MDKITVETKTTVTMGQIKSMLVGAFEGGSNSWVNCIDGYQFAHGITIEDFRDRRENGGSLGKFCNPEDYYHPSQIIPTIDGCAVQLNVDSPKNGMMDEWTKDEPKENGTLRLLLTKEKLIRGVQIMAKVLPKHFHDWMNETDDADTADAYLQCCLFPDMIEKDGNTVFC